MIFFFFFQAEDGIRDYKVTGVQTCALPISTPNPSGGGPPSSSRLGSQNATSKPGFPMRAWFQSSSTARPSRMHRLSLRTSQWTSASPESGAHSEASSSTGSERSSQADEATPAL